MKKLIAFGILSFATAFAHAQDLWQTYTLAASNNPRIREAEANRNAALEARPQSIAGLLPTLSVEGAFKDYSVHSKFRAPEFAVLAGGRNIGFWSGSASVNLTQPLYHHDLWVRLSEADNRIAQAEAEYAAEQQQLILRVASAYFNLLLAEDTLQFAIAEQVAIERQLAQARAFFTAGLTTLVDVNEAQAGYDQAASSVIQATNERDNAKEAMREIVGEYPGELHVLSEDIPLDAPKPGGMDEWDRLGQENNLAILAAKSRVELARNNIDLQFSGHLPSADIVGAAGYTEINRPLGISTDYQQIGVEVHIPLFAGGGVSSRVVQARRELEAAQESLDGRRLAATRQVKDAFRGIESSISQVKALKTALASVESALKLTQAGLEVGTRTMTDVLIGQRNLFRAQRDYAQSRYSYVVNNLRLMEAAGALQPEHLVLVNKWLSGPGKTSPKATDLGG